MRTRAPRATRSWPCCCPPRCPAPGSARAWPPRPASLKTSTLWTPAPAPRAKRSLCARPCACATRKAAAPPRSPRRWKSSRGASASSALSTASSTCTRAAALPAAVALVGGALGIKPVLSVVDGEIKLADTARGRPGALVAMFKQIDKLGGIDPAYGYVLLYSDDKRTVAPVHRYLHENRRLTGGRTAQLGAVIGTPSAPAVPRSSLWSRRQEKKRRKRPPKPRRKKRKKQKAFLPRPPAGAENFCPPLFLAAGMCYNFSVTKISRNFKRPAPAAAGKGASACPIKKAATAATAGRTAAAPRAKCARPARKAGCAAAFSRRPRSLTTKPHTPRAWTATACAPPAMTPTRWRKTGSRRTAIPRPARSRTRPRRRAARAAKRSVPAACASAAAPAGAGCCWPPWLASLRCPASSRCFCRKAQPYTYIY